MAGVAGANGGIATRCLLRVDFCCWDVCAAYAPVLMLLHTGIIWHLVATSLAAVTESAPGKAWLLVERHVHLARTLY